eukprot:XP_002261539.1 integral membrane protein, putative [Plasmodium knowlesi strain H]
MEHADMKGTARILLNDKEVNQEGGARKVRKWLKELVKNVFVQEDTDDAFPFNNKALQNTFWVSQLNIPLIGEDGLTPAKDYVEKVMKDLRHEGIWEKFRSFHSLFWFLPVSDLVLMALPITGMVLSMIAILFNQVNIVTMLPIYIIQQSIYSVGNVWYNYVFEVELLELLFLSLLLVPLCRNHLKCRFSSTPFLRYVCRFFVFKVLLGSSLIRFRNTDLWGHLEGKYYLYETQPLPSSIGYIFHGSFTLSKLDNLFCILTECVFSFFILFPVRSFRLIGGGLIFLYCLLNFVTGNSYLFYVLLLAPLMFCFDDEMLLPFVFKSRRNEVLSVVREKAAQLSRSRGYFQSFDVLFCTGFSVDEVNKMKDAYFRIDSEGVSENVDEVRGNLWNGANRWNGGSASDGWSNTRGVLAHTEKEHLLNRGNSNHEMNFYPEENYMECIKKDVINALHWIFSKKGPQYILNNYNTSKELIIHVLCVFIMIIYNSCVYLTYSTRESIFQFTFYIYVSLFLLYMVYLFFFTKNIFPCLISQVGLLLSVSLIYTKYIFVHGFSDVYFSNLFFLHLFCLVLLSVFHLSNQRFVVKYLCQYFYFVLFLYFLCFFAQNVLSPMQVMNAEYGNFQQMNVYGSFGHINKVRQEIIVRASHPSNASSPSNPRWDNYEFNCKPDNVEKALCSQFRLVYGFLPVLYVDRLDWQFNQLSYSDDETILHTPWFQKFLKKLATNDQHVLSLLYKTPSFVTPSEGKSHSNGGPIHLTVSRDVYRFSPQGEKIAWWEVVSSRVILEQKRHLSLNSAFIRTGAHNRVNRPDEQNKLLHIGGFPVVEHRHRSVSRTSYYIPTDEDTSGKAMLGKMMERNNIRKKKRSFYQQGRMYVEEPVEIEKESLSKKIRKKKKNRYAQKKKKFFRQKKLHELKTEAEEKDSMAEMDPTAEMDPMEEEQMMEGVEKSGREGEEETSPQLEEDMPINTKNFVVGADQDKVIMDDAEKSVDGENLFSAVEKMEAERDRTSKEEAKKRKYRMGVGMREKRSSSMVLPSILSLNGVLPSIMSPRGVLSLDGAIQKEMDEAIQNSYRQYGLLNNFSRKMTKLGFANHDQGRSRYGEIKELLSKRRQEDTHKGT